MERSQTHNWDWTQFYFKDFILTKSKDIETHRLWRKDIILKSREILLSSFFFFRTIPMVKWGRSFFVLSLLQIRWDFPSENIELWFLMKILGTTKGAKKGRGFLVLAFMNQRGRGRDPEACLEYKLNILQFPPFLPFKFGGKNNVEKWEYCNVNIYQRHNLLWCLWGVRQFGKHGEGRKITLLELFQSFSTIW